MNLCKEKLVQITLYNITYFRYSRSCVQSFFSCGSLKDELKILKLLAE